MIFERWTRSRGTANEYSVYLQMKEAFMSSSSSNNNSKPVTVIIKVSVTIIDPIHTFLQSPFFSPFNI